MNEKVHFQQFPPISRIVDDFCGMRCANLYKKPNNWQLVASFVRLELEKMKFNHSRLCPRDPPKLRIFDHFWPMLSRFYASSALHSIKNKILGMQTLLEMIYATFFDISDIKHVKSGKNCEISAKFSQKKRNRLQAIVYLLCIEMDDWQTCEARSDWPKVYRA